MRRLPGFLWVSVLGFGLVACGGEWTTTDDSGITDTDTDTDTVIDFDGDGVPEEEDCDDTDASLGAVADDEDCDGSLNEDDCDDTDETIYPGATETWYDGVDSDCDEASDYDADRDGHDSKDHEGDDCDDTDPESTLTTEDPDCDGEINCSDSLGSLGAPTEVATVSGGGSYGVGAWMSDAGPGESSTVWTMMDYEGDQIIEYASQSDLTSGSISRSIDVDDDWVGTGHTVLNGVLYYNEEDAATLVALDLASETELVRADLPDAGFDNTYRYSWGGLTDIDLSVDGESLYVTYSTAAADGKLVVSRLDPSTLEVLETWTAASAVKNDFTDTFLACGVLYGVDSEEDGGPCFYCTDMTIDLAWNLETGAVSDPEIAFTSPGTSGYTGSVDYNPSDGMIYVVRGGVLGLIEPSWD